ncbi:MAG: hypothetical protein IH914_04750 [candidate division Zixibacteria bacterium]|nr:hypothetical protein [candidate division Zixibacteria bacterium]
MSEILNNREIAILVWLLIVSLYIFRSRDVRKSLASVFETVLSGKILIPVLILAVYMVGIAYFAFSSHHTGGILDGRIFKLRELVYRIQVWQRQKSGVRQLLQVGDLLELRIQHKENLEAKAIRFDALAEQERRQGYVSETRRGRCRIEFFGAVICAIFVSN